ncbi:MAG: hypothetical protein M3433_03405 [Actinomycetota bacterium]|nr:hypothetical protein [Actinomycetota bacterium]
MKRYLLVALVLAALLCVAPAATAGLAARTARVIDCRHWAFYPNVMISSARGMKCRTAVRVMRRHRGSIDYSFRIRGGWRCRRVSGMELGGQWRCRRRGGKAFRFEFGD